MVTDLVKRLEGVTEDDAYAQPWTFGVTCREAAARIEALEASLAAMTEDRDKWAAESAANLRSLAAMTANAEALAKWLEYLPKDFADDAALISCQLEVHRKLMGRK